jgi:hypothetical protein
MVSASLQQSLHVVWHLLRELPCLAVAVGRRFQTKIIVDLGTVHAPEGHEERLHE